MKYKVVWRRPAFNAMDALVTDFPGRREEFAAALQEITAKLSTTPDAEGESRAPPYRVGFFGRLTVHFRVSDDERKVYVVLVHLPFDRLKPE
jgi:hypothetical protein